MARPRYFIFIPMILLFMWATQGIFSDQAPEDGMLIGALISMGILFIAETYLVNKYPKQNDILLASIFYSLLWSAALILVVQTGILISALGFRQHAYPSFFIIGLVLVGLAALFFIVLYLANILISFKHYDAALKLNTLLLKLPFRKLSGHVQRGNIYQHHLRQLDNALTEYEAALNYARKPSMKAVALSWHSNVLTETLQMERALQDANAMIALNVHQDVAHQIRSYIHFYLGDNEAAHADIETGLQHSKTPGAEPMLLAMRGLIYAQEGDFETAHADFKQALKGLPEKQMSGLRSVIYQYMGRTYFAQGEYDAALTAFNKAQDAEPEMTAVLIDQALTQAALGEPKLARQLWHMAAETDARLVTDISWLAQRNYFWCPPLAQAYRDFAATMN